MKKVSRQELRNVVGGPSPTFTKTGASVKSIYTALTLLAKEVKPIAEEAEAAGLKSAKSFNRAIDDAMELADKCYQEAKKALVQHD